MDVLDFEDILMTVAGQDPTLPPRNLGASLPYEMTEGYHVIELDESGHPIAQHELALEDLGAIGDYFSLAPLGATAGGRVSLSTSGGARVSGSTSTSGSTSSLSASSLATRHNRTWGVRGKPITTKLAISSGDGTGYKKRAKDIHNKIIADRSRAPYAKPTGTRSQVNNYKAAFSGTEWTFLYPLKKSAVGTTPGVRTFTKSSPLTSTSRSSTVSRLSTPTADPRRATIARGIISAPKLISSGVSRIGAPRVRLSSQAARAQAFTPAVAKRTTYSGPSRPTIVPVKNGDVDTAAWGAIVATPKLAAAGTTCGCKGLSRIQQLLDKADLQRTATDEHATINNTLAFRRTALAKLAKIQSLSGRSFGGREALIKAACGIGRNR